MEERFLQERLRLRAATITAACFLFCNSAAAQPAGGATTSLADVVATTLDRAYGIRLEQESIRRSQGDLRAARGAFDPQLTFSAGTGREQTLYTEPERRAYEVAASERGLVSYRLGVAQQFRSGISLRPSVELARTDAFTFDAAPVVRARAGLSILYPLLRGRSSAAAALEAAEENLDASELDVRFTAQKSLLSAVVAYWQYLGAYAGHRIHSEAEERARLLLADTERLVAAGERPAADLDQLRANLADRITARIASDQHRLEARQQLGLAMGLAPELRPSQPSDPFPGLEEALQLPPHHTLIAAALERRPDVLAARRREASARLLVRAGMNEAKPGLNLQLDVGYAGLSEGELRLTQHLPPLGQADISGGSASITLAYDIPIGNNRGAGAVARQEAAFRQSRIVVDDLEHRVGAGVTIAAELLRSSAAELQMAGEAVRLYRSAVENERRKLHLGMATLFDVTLVEERLRNALLVEVSAHSRYAQAIVRLRFETGTLPVGGAVSDILPHLLRPPSSE